MYYPSTQFEIVIKPSTWTIILARDKLATFYRLQAALQASSPVTIGL